MVLMKSEFLVQLARKARLLHPVQVVLVHEARESLV